MKKPLKIALVAAGILVTATLIGTLAAPPLTKRYIEKHDRELLGRSIRMERLRMNPLTGRLRVEGLRIGGAEDSTTFFTLDSFDMRLRLWPLLGRRVVVKRIRLVGPDVKLYQQGTAFSFDDLTARFASDTATVATEPSAPWEIGIYDITIRNGHLFYKDLALGATWGLNDIGLHIPGVCFGGEKTDVGAVLNFAEGGSLTTEVAYDIASSEFDVSLRLDALTLAGMLPYFRQSLDIDRVDGRLWADVRLRGDLEHLLSLRADGTASLADFTLTDKHQRPVAGIDSLGMQIAEVDLGRMRFLIDRLYVGGFSLLAELTKEGNNLAALMKRDEPQPMQPDEANTLPETPSETDAPSVVPSLQIADLEIARGRIDLRDLSLERPFEYTLNDIRMRSRDFNPSKRIRLQIDARMQRTGEAKLRWEGTLDDMNNQNITLTLANIDLRDFSPYSEHFTAYPLTAGNLTFRSQNVISNRHLDGTNHLDVFEPKADKKCKDIEPEMHIPLKLGLYVLKDKKGHVKMDLPVGGNLDSPEFSYRKIVLKAIGNVLLKVVSAPFSFLSGGRDNLSYIALDAQQYAFTSEQYASFDRIAVILRDKPDMQIALTQRIGLQRALPQQAVRNLQLEYHNHLAATDSAGRRPRLSMLEYEKSLQTDIRSAQVTAFADSLLAERGIAASGLSPEAKALALYRDRADEQLRRSMEMRDKALAEYMHTAHGLQAPTFSIQPADSAALATYHGRDRYTIALGAEGETVEIGAETAKTEEMTTDTTNIPSETNVPAAKAGTEHRPVAVDPASTPNGSEASEKAA